MKDQHKKITGYRDLNQTEIDLMNKIKAKGEELKQLLEETETNLSNMTDPMLNQDSMDDMQRSLELAKDNLQQGMMWFVRAVARPQSF
jgi:response regulator of citrate/malate metabolism